MILVGGFLTYSCRENLRWSWASRNWPHTRGRVAGSKVYEGIMRGVGTDGTCAPRDQRFRQVDRVVEFSVGGQQYDTSRFSFFTTGWGTNDRYLEEGDKVEVYYNPADPAMAVIRPGLGVNLLIGPALFCGGLCLLLYQLVVR